MAEYNSHSERTFKYGSNVVAGIVLFLVILGAINYLAGRSQVRLDLTRGKQHTVSDSTKELLKKLDDTVTVNVYATAQGTPPDWAQQRRQLMDLLYEYRRLSGGKVSYKPVDPSADDKLKREAEQAGIREIPMQQAGRDEVSLKLGFMGMTVQYRGNTETISVISPDDPLEYQLTRAIDKVARKDRPKVGLLVPAGNPFMGEQSQYGFISQVMELEGFEPKTLEASNLRDLDGLQLVMVIEPGELSEEALYRLDQYVMKGGKLFVAASGVEIDQRSGRATPKLPNINSILEHYGMRVEQNIVEDWGRVKLMPMQTQRGIVLAPNPFIVDATDLSKESVITKDLRALIFPYTSSVSKSDLGSSASVEVLAKSSEKSRKQEQFFNLQPDRLKKPGKDEQLQAFNVMMSVAGPLKSRFATVDPPVLTQDNGTTRAVAASEVVKESPAGAQVIVASSAFAFINDVVAPRGSLQANGILLLNLADALTRGGQMIALRSKQAESALLRPEITPAEKATVQALVIGAVPVLLVVFGIFMASIGRMKKARYRDIYAHGEE